MKNLYLLVFLLCSMTGYSQWYNIDYKQNYRFISFSADPANAIYGSDKNSRGLDAVVKIGANHGKVRVSVFYEVFDLIRYQSWGVQPSFVLYPWKNIQLLAGTEVSIINRYGPTFASYAFNGEIEYHVHRFFVSAKADLKRRPDIRQKWSYSNYISLGFKF